MEIVIAQVVEMMSRALVRRLRTQGRSWPKPEDKSEVDREQKRLGLDFGTYTSQ